MSDSPSPDAYTTVIADLLAKRAQIDQTITLLEGLQGNSPTRAAVSAINSAPSGDVVETAGMYLGMSIVDASKKLLALRKRTLGNVEIARDLQAGGLVLNSKEPPNVVGSVLTRRFNDIGDVVKVGRGIWGLKEWYPGRNFKPAKVAVAEKQLDDLGLADDPDKRQNAEQTDYQRELTHAFTGGMTDE